MIQEPLPAWPDASKAIVEFETFPERFYPSGRPGEKLKTAWHSKVSIDLRCVASAHKFEAGSSCIIAMAGTGAVYELNVPYETFKELWMAAKA